MKFSTTKQFSIISLGTLVLAGCVSTQVISANQTTVIVKASLKTPGEAQFLADNECGKYQKSASLNQYVPANTVWANYFFDCKAR
jgi:uncharacterized protein YcfL